MGVMHSFLKCMEGAADLECFADLNIFQPDNLIW